MLFSVIGVVCVWWLGESSVLCCGVGWVSGVVVLFSVVGEWGCVGVGWVWGCGVVQCCG